MRQQLVEIERAHDRSDVGHGQLQERILQPLHFVGGARRIEHLIEGDAVDSDGGVVLGDDLLRRHVEHLLHHVHLRADAIDERNDDAEAGPERAREAAETLDGIVVSLRDGLDAGEQHQDDQDDDRDDDPVEAHG